MKTTNYQNTFIEIADDSAVKQAEVPPKKAAGETMASLQFDLIMKHPYRYTSDDVIFQVYAVRNAVKAGEAKAAREKFFSKGQPCLRSSPLAKRYGWGIHHDGKGKVALYPLESADYEKFKTDPQITHVKAMRSKRG